MIPQNKDLWNREVIVLAREDVKHSPAYKNCITIHHPQARSILYTMSSIQNEREMKTRREMLPVSLNCWVKEKAELMGHVLFQEIISKIFNDINQADTSKWTIFKLYISNTFLNETQKTNILN